ncbi:MAG: hypothetical protein KDC53_19740 [Saprospiraceae bacterium]|nr:hypothetical protein [Saprospiraceae bacterium]
MIRLKTGELYTLDIYEGKIPFEGYIEISKQAQNFSTSEIIPFGMYQYRSEPAFKGNDRVVISVFGSAGAGDFYKTLEINISFEIY